MMDDDKIEYEFPILEELTQIAASGDSTGKGEEIIDDEEEEEIE